MSRVTCHAPRVACCLVRVPAGTAGETSRRRGARRSSCPSLHLLPGPRLAHTGRTLATLTLGTAAVCNNTKTDEDVGKENMFKVVDTCSHDLTDILVEMLTQTGWVMNDIFSKRQQIMYVSTILSVYNEEL